MNYKVGEKFGIRIFGYNVNNKIGSIYVNSGLMFIVVDYIINNM